MKLYQLFCICVLAALLAAGVAPTTRLYAQPAGVLPTDALGDVLFSEEAPGDGPWVVRAYYTDRQMVSDLAAWREPWEVHHNQGYLVVDVDRDDYQRLLDAGFRVEIDQALTDEFNRPRAALPDQVTGIPSYPCYRTVEETFSAAQAIVAAHPDLASWVDIGNSWEKITPGGNAGYDMMVLRLTNAAIPGPKPKLFIMGSVHAREYTPAELNTRFAEYLINNYGVDADATWLLDYHEMHLLLQANPDGRKRAEAGTDWRKNTDNDDGCSSGYGVDLNRNFEFRWGCCGGSSGSPCDETYRGPAAASEPEVQAVQTYVRAQFPDQRGSDLNAAAPLTATGVFLDLHSYSELVLWPWGFDSITAPNSAGLQTLGRKFAYFNGYEPEQSVGLYPTDGTTDDFAYGDLGLAAYTFEMGTSFFQSCSVFENTIVPGNLPALVYAAKAARTPYMTPAGPDALSIVVGAGGLYQGGMLHLTASLNDTRYSNVNGIEPTQAIAAAEFYVDTPPWVTSTTPLAHPMTATDGAFDETIEAVEGLINPAGLNAGRHIVFVHGQDADGNWGVFSAAFFDVTQPDFTLALEPDSLEVCAPDGVTASLQVAQVLTYTQPVSLMVLGAPSGAWASLTPAVITPTGLAMLSLEVGGAAAQGAHTLVVSGTGGMVHALQQPVWVNTGLPAAPELLAPSDGALDQPLAGLAFDWQALAYTPAYGLQVDRAPTFAAPLVDLAALDDSAYTLAALDPATCYFWRTRGDNACGAGGWSAPFRFATLAIGLGLDDDMEAGSGLWTHQAAVGSDDWTLSTAQAHSPTHAWFVPDAAVVTDSRLWNTTPLAVGVGSTLTFWHRYQFEGTAWDGSVLEISTNGGTTWVDLGAYITANGYNGTLSTEYSNPLGERSAWTGDLTTWTKVEVDLSSFAGQTAQLRWRLGCDSSLGDVGWYIDDIQITTPLPPNPAPMLLSITPGVASTYTDTSVQISGLGFVATPNVKLGDTWLLSVTLVSSTTLNAVVPAGLPVGVYTLTLYNGADCQAASLPYAFSAQAGYVSVAPGDWHDPSTWLAGDVPTYTDDVTITAGMQVTISTPAGCHNLLVEPGAQLSVEDGMLTVKGELTNRGRLRQARVVDGSQPVDFLHIQDSSGAPGGADRYLGLVISPTAGMGLVDVVVRGHQACGSDGTLTQTVQRCYDVAPQIAQTAVVTFYYGALEANGHPAPTVYHWSDGLHQWQALTPTLTGGGGEALWARATVLDYSPFALKDPAVGSSGTPTAVRVWKLAGAWDWTWWPVVALALFAVGALVLVVVTRQQTGGVTR